MKRAVRAMVVDRDGYCRLSARVQRLSRDEREDITMPCEGESEWAHLEDKRRARTVGMAPEERHTTAGSLMLCRAHHRAYDGARISITLLSRYGADGPLRFTGRRG